MPDEKSYDLSLLGDLKSKLIGILIALASFATVIRTALNNLTSWFGISYNKAYVVFIFIYFLMPILFFIVFIIRKKELIYFAIINNYPRKRDDKLPIDHSFSYRIKSKTWIMEMCCAVIIFTLLGTIVFYKSDMPLCAIRFWFGLGALSVIFIGLIPIVYSVPWKSYKRRLLLIEYLIIALVSSLAFWLVINKNMDALADDKKEEHSPIDSVFRLFEVKKDFGEKVVDKAETLKNKLAFYNDNFNLTAQSQLNGLTTNKEVNNEIILVFDDTLRKSIFYWDGMFSNKWIDTLSNIKSDSAFYKSIQNIFKTIDSSVTGNYVVPFRKRSSTNTKNEMDNLYLDLKKVNTYKFVGNEMAQLSKKLNEELSKKLNNEWLYRIQLLQVKGLVWFFVFLMIVYTILYNIRNALLSQDDFLSKHRKTARTARIYQTKVDDLSSAGNTSKIIIFLIVLLTIPYFKTFTEKNIDSDKPFLNFDLSDITGGLIKGDDGKNKYGYVDSSRSNLNIGNLNIYIIDPKDTALHASANDDVLRLIKILGAKSVTDVDDRNEFKKIIEDLENKQKK